MKAVSVIGDQLCQALYFTDLQPIDRLVEMASRWRKTGERLQKSPSEKYCGLGRGLEGKVWGEC